MTKLKTISVEKFVEIMHKELDIFLLHIQNDQKQNPDNWSFEGGVETELPFGDWTEQFSVMELLPEHKDSIF